MYNIRTWANINAALTNKSFFVFYEFMFGHEEDKKEDSKLYCYFIILYDDDDDTQKNLYTDRWRPRSENLP